MCHRPAPKPDGQTNARPSIFRSQATSHFIDLEGMKDWENLAQPRVDKIYKNLEKPLYTKNACKFIRHLTRWFGRENVVTSTERRLMWFTRRAHQVHVWYFWTCTGCLGTFRERYLKNGHFRSWMRPVATVAEWSWGPPMPGRSSRGPRPDGTRRLRRRSAGSPERKTSWTILLPPAFSSETFVPLEEPTPTTSKQMGEKDFNASTRSKTVTFLI